MIANSSPYRTVTAKLIAPQVNQLFYDRFTNLDAVITKCFEGLKTDDELLMHSHGSVADHLLTTLIAPAQFSAHRRNVKLCLAATQHGEVEQFLARHLTHKDEDDEANTIFNYFEDMLMSRDVLFYVARKNLWPYSHSFFSTTAKLHNAKAKSFKVMNGIKAMGDNDVILSSIGLQSGRFTFIVASRADDECKGHYAVAQAIQTINAGSRNTQAIFLGDGKEVDRVNEKIKRGEIYDVHCVGQVSSAQEWMHLADCHILATSCKEESLPMCISDAHFKRVPTISTNIGDIKEMMEGAGIVMQLKDGHVTAKRSCRGHEGNDGFKEFTKKRPGMLYRYARKMQFVIRAQP